MTASIVITAPGFSTTVQDAGRGTQQSLGVPPSGVMDPLAMAAANALVGNPADAAVLEFCHVGPGFEVGDAPLRAAIVGGDAAIRRGDGEIVPANRSVVLQPGETVALRAPQSAVYAVLALSGGIDVPEVMGSRSTFLRGAFGGLDGRPLAAGDTLRAEAADLALADQELAGDLPYGEGPLRVVLGPQADYFDDDSLAAFLSGEYRITRESDRMGMRLDGAPLSHVQGYDIATDGVVNGSIQVPGNGLPVLLLRDRQTTGGYPKIASVVSADLPRLGAMRPGDVVRFAAVGIDEAVALRRAQQQRLDELCRSLRPVRRFGAVDLAALMSENLISGVVAGDE